MKAHGSQKRASGDPYFSHPLEVAAILTDLKLDTDTIVTALLHDVVEDTVATIPEIEKVFGKKIAELVDGVTKLSKIELQTESVRQAENFRKFLLAMSNDIRVLLIKLADRCHNMRTLSFIKRPEKRKRIALETLEIYAPLAERIGMHELKDELEHLAFENLDPEALASINARLDYLIEKSPNLVKEMVAALEELLKGSGIEARVSSRIKRPYSIWRKMERQNTSFEQLSDVMAFRIIVKDVPTCYQGLGIVHQRFQMVPGRFKDYISIPKRNFYRSLHTAVMGPKNNRLEIQFRTEEMHEEAELGVAAHWQYKQKSANAEGSQYLWIRELLEILDETHDPEEFLEHTKLAMFQDQVFCFTPKGELVSLPRGSSAVDFAYAVHSEVGNHCVGAKVNGRMVPLRHQLENGDQVQVLTSEGQEPSPRWESFVVTGKARSSIRRHLRQQKQVGFANLGKVIIEKACRRNQLDFSSQVMEEAVAVLNLGDADTLFALVGQGSLMEEEVLTAAFPGFQKDACTEGLPTIHQNWEEISGGSVPISGVKRQSAVHFSDCCHPVRGDRIVGIHVADKGAEIHTIDCSQLEKYDEDPDAWLDLKWQAEEEGDDAFYTGRLRLDVINERGALASIAATVSKNGGNVSNLIISDRDPEFYVMVIDVEVRDVKHLNDVGRALRVSRVIGKVERVLG
ncbi:MAG: bifunctional (p)ppGpp synthetase/guanosine-3',5'-bis(diphosphate) 3'-pyrophosphohydrolase [Kordiimonadaceae bacterium]|nr:bifunctional (p)ppGpp synthetase/guanosine-3',5'-bis(diphosphate) 3'-pyrophosphohydrolase [Kordiimonadaceae bacterium]